MAVDHERLPRDDNGIVQGAYRILHEDPTFNGPIGIYTLVDGESTSPACGRALRCAVGEYGPKLYLEPWGELPAGFMLPEMVSPDVPSEALARFERCPWRAAKTSSVPAVVTERATRPDEAATAAEAAGAPAEAATQSIDTMGRDDLIALAELHEVPVDRRWGETKLRRALVEAGITGV